MRSTMVALAGTGAIVAVVYLVFATRPETHSSTAAAIEPEATSGENRAQGSVTAPTGAPRVAARPEVATAPVAVPAAALPILTGPAPFDPKPIEPFTEKRSFPAVKEVEPVHEVGAAVAYRQ